MKKIIISMLTIFAIGFVGSSFAAFTQEDLAPGKPGVVVNTVDGLKQAADICPHGISCKRIENSAAAPTNRVTGIAEHTCNCL